MEERDLDYNPYREMGDVVLKVDQSADRKLFLQQSDHTYYLIKDRELYLGNIISASSVYSKLYNNGQDGRFIWKDPSLPESSRKDEDGKLVWDDPPEEIFEKSPRFQIPSVDMSGGMKYAQLGTLFHWYADRRLNGKTIEFANNDDEGWVDVMVSGDGDSSKQHMECETYESIRPQLDMFEKFCSKIPKGTEVKTEIPVASYRHKMCGQIDCMIRDPKTGEMVLVDWKLSKVLLSDENLQNYDVIEGGCDIIPGFHVDTVFKPKPGKITWGLLTYLMQLATYRKLNQLNGVPTASVAYLAVASSDGGFGPNLKFIRVDFEQEIFFKRARYDLSERKFTLAGEINRLFLNREIGIRRHFGLEGGVPSPILAFSKKQSKDGIQPRPAPIRGNTKDPKKNLVAGPGRKEAPDGHLVIFHKAPPRSVERSRANPTELFSQRVPRKSIVTEAIAKATGGSVTPSEPEDSRRKRRTIKRRDSGGSMDSGELSDFFNSVVRPSGTSGDFNGFVKRLEKSTTSPFRAKQ